jgi:hypothetical protein
MEDHFFFCSGQFLRKSPFFDVWVGVFFLDDDDDVTFRAGEQMR